MYVAKTFEVDGLTVKIVPDEDPMNPRREWDNAATLVCWHQRQDMGDENIAIPEPGTLPEVIAEYTPEEWLPVYLYEHSGQTINTTGFTCPWDSGQVGFIFMTEDDIKREYNEVTDETREQARKLMQAEVETYDQYLRGDIYGFIIEDEDENTVDSVWDFYGLDYATSEAREAAESAAKALREEKAAEQREEAFWAARGVPTVSEVNA